MKKYTSYILVGLTLCAYVLASCGERKRKDGRTDTYSSGVIRFASDESFSPIIDEERNVFQSTYPNAKVNPIYTNESDGINRLLKGSVNLVITRPKESRISKLYRSTVPSADHQTGIRRIGVDC